MYEKSKDRRKRKSKLGVDPRKSESSSKTQIQSKVGCTKSRRTIETVDPIWGWIHEKAKVRQKRRSKAKLDVQKVEGPSKTYFSFGDYTGCSIKIVVPQPFLLLIIKM